METFQLPFNLLGLVARACQAEYIYISLSDSRRLLVPDCLQSRQREKIALSLTKSSSLQQEFECRL